MKICHIGWPTSPHVASWVCWLAQRSHENHFIADSPADIDGITVHIIQRDFHDPRPRWNRFRDFSFHDYRLAKWAWLRLKIREIQPDILHSHSLWYPGYLGLFTGFHPWVVTVFNGDVLWKPEGRPWIDRLRTRIALRKADLVTGVSKTLVSACQRLGADSHKTQVIRRGVQLSLFNCDRPKAEVRHELGLPVDVPIVLSPRSLTTADYNVEAIVESIPLVRQRVSNVLFVFIYLGAANERDVKLHRRTKELEVTDAVQFVGRVTCEKVQLYHRAADVMISAALMDSGPVALQEAMACGDVPVISDLPCVREWITDGWNGLLVDPENIDQIAESITRLLQNEEVRKSFAERNWKLIQEKGDQDYWMGKMEELYYRLITEKR